MKQVSKWQAIFLLTCIILIISTSLLLFSAEPHVSIFFSIILLILFVLVTKRPWSLIEEGMKNGISSVINPIILFIFIGILIAILMLSGTIPTIIYFGSTFMSPTFFLPSVFIITSIIGSCLGSAFTTISTVGVALLAVGSLMGIDTAIIAGAIVSGAYLGDKMSPLSDTTNLAAAVCKVDLFDHIKHMLWTTIPAFFMTLLLLTFVSFFLNWSPEQVETNSEIVILKETGLVNSLSLIPLVLIFLLAWKRVPAILVLLCGILAGLIVAFLLNPTLSITTIMNVIQNGFTIETGSESINSMLNRGGIQSMLWSISLVILTLTMGGIIQALGLLEKIFESIQKVATTTGKLVLAVACTAIGINVTVGEQYLSILLTGNVYKGEFDKRGLSNKNLSKIIEDAGTVINPLIPYGVSGVFIASVLNVPVMEYLPFAFFCLLSPLLSIFYGFTGISMKKV